ncbi:protein of unknown function [Streptococcus thermophilus]|uniref:Uncharacterized protein n=1 Tax=Streptococcus thermophilus TaxID=1308 RepID=A0A8D6U532_STRTR|nr:protein of unknown function [Streptococcus thermophilus]
MTKQTKDVQTVIDELATKGVEVLDAMANFTQEQVDPHCSSSCDCCPR